MGKRQELSLFNTPVTTDKSSLMPSTSALWRRSSEVLQHLPISTAWGPALGLTWGPQGWEEEEQHQRGFPRPNSQLILPGSQRWLPWGEGWMRGSPLDWPFPSPQCFIPLCSQGEGEGGGGGCVQRSSAGKFFCSRRMALLKHFCPTAHC